jgi:hypothetical protein
MDLTGNVGILTFIANQIYVSAMIRDTDGMILHPRATANVTNNDDLDMIIFGIPRWGVSGWDAVEN